MSIPRTTMIDDDGSGLTGTILNNAWKQELYNQIDATPPIIQYTPTWNATGTPPTLGNSTIAGWYTRQGQLVNFWLEFVLGTTATMGSGAWYFSLPLNVNIAANFALCASYTHASGQNVAGGGVYSGMYVFVYAPGAPNGIGSSLPFAWVPGDNVVITGSFISYAL